MWSRHIEPSYRFEERVSQCVGSLGYLNLPGVPQDTVELRGLLLFSLVTVCPQLAQFYHNHHMWAL
jgi:hypothetical protein